MDAGAIAATNVGETVDLQSKLVLDLHGHEIDVRAQLTFARLSRDAVLVVTRRPVVVNAGSVGLVEGVERLREVAGLPSISRAVPVSATLLFRRSP